MDEEEKIELLRKALAGFLELIGEETLDPVMWPRLAPATMAARDAMRVTDPHGICPECEDPYLHPDRLGCHACEAENQRRLFLLAKKEHNG